MRLPLKSMEEECLFIDLLLVIWRLVFFDKYWNFALCFFSFLCYQRLFSLDGRRIKVDTMLGF